MGSTESICIPEPGSKNDIQWDIPIIRRGEIYNFSFYKKISKINQKNTSNITIRININGVDLDDSEIQYDQQETSNYQWNLKSSNGTEDTIAYHLETPCDCEIGEYELTVKLGKKVLGKLKFLMLFNPWNPYDETYIPNEEERIEYILNKKTIVYHGFSFAVCKNEWDLGQFSRETILTFLYLFRKIKKSVKSSAYELARELTALVNHNDDDGVVVGRWKMKFSGGESPNYWSSSTEIFGQYLKHKKPVKFGQCFTFAEILCSLCRFMGLGCRIVTCYECLLDGDDTLDMEQYFDEKGNLIKELSNDSIWTFHCWNECYMKCPGVEKYNGWHVLDATPQIVSKHGGYTCGPAPVAAIKSGDLKVGYDTRFVYSEVNGDIISKMLIKEKFQIIGVEKCKIGKNIKTKSVGSTQPNDITHLYKYIDGGPLHAMARKHADNVYGLLSATDIIRVQPINNTNYIVFGEDLNLEIELLNVPDSKVDLLLKFYVVQHPNIHSKEIDNKMITFYGTDGEKKSIIVSGKKIFSKVESDQCCVLVELFVTDQDRMHNGNLYFPIKTPSFDIMVPDVIKINENCEIYVNLENQLHMDLRNVHVILKVAFCETKHQKIIEYYHMPYILINSRRRLKKGSSINAKFIVKPTTRGFYEVKAIIYGDKFPAFKEVKSVTII